MSLSDPEVTRNEYASESRLLGRRSIYDTSEGPSPLDVLWERIAEVEPRRVLEVGPGPGELSERMAKELGAEVVAIDISPRMVELTRERGDRRPRRRRPGSPVPRRELRSRRRCLGAVPSSGPRSRGERDRARLRPGGRLVAATNSEAHLQELWELVGVERIGYSFSAENAVDALRPHFADVKAYPVEGWVTFADTETVRHYVASSIIHRHLAESVPDLDAPLRVRRKNAVFVAER